MNEKPDNQEDGKPEKLLFESYLQMIKDSPGTNMFRHFWVRPKEGEERQDILSDGVNSCAYYVSAVLKLFDKIDRPHATVTRTLEAIEESGWEQVEGPEPGDVVVWEARKFGDKWHRHIGFCIGDGKAISTSWIEKVPVEHDLHFGDQKRAIEHIYRTTDW